MTPILGAGLILGMSNCLCLCYPIAISFPPFSFFDYSFQFFPCFHVLSWSPFPDLLPTSRLRLPFHYRQFPSIIRSPSYLRPLPPLILPFFATPLLPQRVSPISAVPHSAVEPERLKGFVTRPSGPCVLILCYP